MSEIGRNRLKKALLYLAKYSGVFGLSRFFTSDALRILCYHGTAFDDEYQFRPGVFMRPETFARRMTYLKSSGFPVLGLEDALTKLREHRLPKNAVAITIDDGWYGSYCHMLPVLRDMGLPATIYVSTYYVEKQTFVFPMFVDYVLMKARQRAIDLSKVHRTLTGRFRLDFESERNEASDRICSLGEGSMDAEGRQTLCRDLSTELGFDIARAEERRILRYMTSDELARMPSLGFDVQLHTHRHRFSQSDRDEVEREIADNLRVLTRLGVPSAKHFCYPSGEYAQAHPAWLEALGIESAVTTERGFCTARTSKFLLARLCDSEQISDIEFEAELSGLLEVLRRVRRLLTPAPTLGSSPTAASTAR
jgi:peptidoglycan/xylan/chitin deacetylase (PgdA/CDA1 family)